MELIKAEGIYLDQLKELYEEAFPREEKKPFALMERCAEEGKMEILAVVEDGKFIGLDINMLVPGTDLALLDYFAIDPNLRGGGYGSRALKLILERFKGNRMIFEIERPDDAADNAEQRLRRRNFYMRNGLLETGIFASFFGAEFELLVTEGTITYEDYVRALSETLGEEMMKLGNAQRLEPLQ